MKFTIEIPDEDLEKIEEYIKGNEIAAELWGYSELEEFLQEFFNMLGKTILKKLYEGILAVEAGVITLEECMTQMSIEGMKIGVKAEMEAEKRSKDKALQTEKG